MYNSLDWSASVSLAVCQRSEANYPGERTIWQSRALRAMSASGVVRGKSTGEQSYEQMVRYDAALNCFVAIPIDVSNPNEQGFLAIFGTGLRGRSSLANVSDIVGNINVEVLYAGEQGFYAGLDQVNIRLPRSLSGSGEIAIAIRVDGIAANPIKINVK